MSTSRLQLSMYVPPASACFIEHTRQQLDPVQHRLIPAHITLCRESELAAIEDVKQRLRKLSFPPLTLQFGKAEAFFEHGWLLPCIAGQPMFRALREYLLASTAIHEQQAHITLAHPRNPKSPSNCLANATALPERFELTFPTINLIRQENAQPWQVLEHYSLT